MIELRHDNLVFSFPEVHPDAELSIDFQRTLRIPDDDKDYPLPPGLGRFPLRHVDDFADRLPPQWTEHGGIMLPMHQAEAMWLNFSTDDVDDRAEYPFAIKVAAGKINAITGQPWENGLADYPQDYMVAPKQPWLDGYCVQKGIIRQFVAMPLGDGYTAEEQITSHAEHGGLQIWVCPMKRKVFERRFRKRPVRSEADFLMVPDDYSVMGLAAGGRMKQEIYTDPYDFDDWDQDQSSRCFVHICNSIAWRAFTTQAPPTTPPTAKEYTDAGMPWFDYYDESVAALDAKKTLEQLKSVKTLGQEKQSTVLPENESVTGEDVVHVGPSRTSRIVRDGKF